MGKGESMNITNDERYEFIKLYDILRDMDFELTDLQVSVFEKIQDSSLITVNEPKLFPVRHTLEEARARQASLKETQAQQAAMRQGQL